MLVKLGQAITKSFAKGFNRDTVSKMVKAYRKKPAGAAHLKYAHFTVQEIMDLFIANGIIDPKLSIESQTNSIKEFGVKIYLGRHIAGTAQDVAHGNKNTTILVNTKIEPGHFYDILDDLKSISFAGADVELGNGLDQAEISPPYHENPGEDTEDEDANNIP